MKKIDDELSNEGLIAIERVVNHGKKLKRALDRRGQELPRKELSGAGQELSGGTGSIENKASRQEYKRKIQVDSAD